MSSYPPPYPPPGYDPRAQRRFLKDQERFQRQAQRDAYRAQRDLYRMQTRGLRRSSIAGPLMLIAIGVYFLLLESGRISQQHAFDWFASWWPTLLLAAGVIVLVEWLVDQYLQRSGAPPYRRSLGGLFFLVIPLLVVTGVVASASRGHEDFFTHGFGINPDNLDEFIGDKHDSDQTLDLTLPRGSAISVTNPRGNVTVSGGSDDNQIHIAVHKQIYSRSDSDADAKAQQFTPQVSKGSTFAITMPTMDGAHADLILTVPADAPLTVTGNHGDIHVAEMKAAVNASANHGDIEFSAITGPVTAHINSGSSSIAAHALGAGLTIEGHADDVTVSDLTGPLSIRGEYYGTTHLEHIAGPIVFHTSRTDFQLGRLDGNIEISPHSELTADSALGPVSLTTSNRNITLDRIAGDISVTNRNGTIDVTAAPTVGNITIVDHNGSIKTVLPEHAGFVVQADTSNGDIDTDYSLSASEHGSGKTASGTVGAGGPHLSITNRNGDIAIRKGNVEPLPPTPPVAPKLTFVTPKPPAPPVVKVPSPPVIKPPTPPTPGK